jgi:hypothetical protein
LEFREEKWTFFLAINPLQRLFERATRIGLLHPVQHRSVKLRVSLYADDATIFLNPSPQKFTTALQILQAFGQASGKVTNL